MFYAHICPYLFYVFTVYRSTGLEANVSHKCHFPASSTELHLLKATAFWCLTVAAMIVVLVRLLRCPTAPLSLDEFTNWRHSTFSPVRTRRASICMTLLRVLWLLKKQLLWDLWHHTEHSSIKQTWCLLDWHVWHLQVWWCSEGIMAKTINDTKTKVKMQFIVINWNYKRWRKKVKLSQLLTALK